VKAWARFSRANPGRAKPPGVSSGWRTKPSSGRQELWEGSKPRNRGPLGRPTASAVGVPMGETVGGCIRVVTPPIPLEREMLRRANPMSAAGAKQNRHGFEGRKPPGG
jgi:hypothetical protein